MSINKVTVNFSHTPTELPFELFSGEKLHFQSPSPRQALAIASKQSSSNHAVHISSAEGKLYLTNKRLVYLTQGQGDIETFSIEFSGLAKMQFSHAVKSPWFGPNYWSFMLYSAAGTCDGLPRDEWFEGSISFKDGGLFDFAASFDRVLTDAVDNPHIDDELPRYSEL